MNRLVLWVWGAACVLLMSSGGAAAQSARPFLTVVASGPLPGFVSADVPSYLSDHMTAAPLDEWAFEPIFGDFRPPTNRVEWSFRIEQPPAGDTGSVSLNKPRFVARQVLTAEVRLFLNDQFQTVTFAQTEIYGGAGDEELAAFVQRTSERLLGASGAYKAISRRVSK